MQTKPFVGQIRKIVDPTPDADGIQPLISREYPAG